MNSANGRTPECPGLSTLHSASDCYPGSALLGYGGLRASMGAGRPAGTRPFCPLIFCGHARSRCGQPTDGSDGNGGTPPPCGFNSRHDHVPGRPLPEQGERPGFFINHSRLCGRQTATGAAGLPQPNTKTWDLSPHCFVVMAGGQAPANPIEANG